jgi:predicted nucleotidyltransferase
VASIEVERTLAHSAFRFKLLAMSLVRLTAKKLTAAQITAEVDRLLTDCKKQPGLIKVILFGSANQGTMTEASDLDLVLIFATATEAKQASRSMHALRTTSWPADLLCIDEKLYEDRSQSGGVFFVARNEGRVIYERKMS